ncbi:discoidin domain-containing protein [Gracilibacillus kekensis]|uniref:F5/8 type C domain-containing protein n=1 Tax=Gracilibacillus kekensis TaxID=1027249 RepID=A0A1M7QT61_9BACI|nr:discoidin domain-containing protein [Gracilibacillus kekensis]SHN34973.1 F5/8 type C domain-containing protein [Gracilibacillus kekensis]
MKTKRMFFILPVIFMTALFIGLVIELDTVHATSHEYFVDPENGSDSNYGISEGDAFKTVQHAHDQTEPGDTVFLMNGTHDTADGQAVLRISRSGTSNNYITYTAYPGHNPVLFTDSAWNVILVEGASYIRIDGLEIKGNNDNISSSDAWNRSEHFVDNVDSGTVNWSYLAPTNTNGVFMKYANDNVPHHIEVRNMNVSDLPGCGICTEHADYITIEDNEVYENSHYTIYATSGISIFHPRDIDNNTGYKNIIRRNKVYNNYTTIHWGARGYISDGNGIIYDDSKNSQSSSLWTGEAYEGRTLIENNISYLNGGSGIHSFSSEHVDIVNNTAFHNSQKLDYGEIYAGDSNDVNLFNNIMYAEDSSKPVNRNWDNNNVNYNYNVYFNGIVNTQGSDDIVTDPEMVNPWSGNFKLQSSSPAKDSGTSSLAPSEDFEGNARPSGAIDRGAYEYQSDGQSSGEVVRDKWTATAFGTPHTDPNNAIDASQNSAYYSGASMKSGQWFRIDLGSSQSISRIQFSSDDPGNFPDGVDIYISDDYNWGTPVASVANNTNQLIDVSFSATTGRYIVVAINTSKSSWWQINDFRAYH